MKAPRPRVICLGSAACQPVDLAAAAELGVTQANGWLLVAVNHAARDWPGEVPHWATYHSDLLPKWIGQRAAAARPPAGRLWTGERRVMPKGIDLQRAPNWGGSSGLLAVSVALNRLSALQIVLIGIPLDHEQGHYDSPKKWRDATNYRRGWVTHQDAMANVRSMSGWTQGLLGAPTREWLDGKQDLRDAGEGDRDGRVAAISDGRALGADG